MVGDEEPKWSEFGCLRPFSDRIIQSNTVPNRHAHKFGRRRACTEISSGYFRPTCTLIRSEKCVHDEFPIDVHTNSVREVRARQISDRSPTEYSVGHPLPTEMHRNSVG